MGEGLREPLPLRQAAHGALSRPAPRVPRAARHAIFSHARYFLHRRLSQNTSTKVLAPCILSPHHRRSRSAAGATCQRWQRSRHAARAAHAQANARPPSQYTRRTEGTIRERPGNSIRIVSRGFHHMEFAQLHAAHATLIAAAGS
eukprot:6214743-Pleurochrysis_carterae.AAC.3